MVSPKNPSDPVYHTRYQRFCMETTGCPPVSSIIKTRRLRSFGHVARSDSRQDHQRAASASLRPPRDCRRPRGRPCTTWLRDDADVQSANIGIHSAWRKANDRVLWPRIDMATLHWHATKEDM